MILEASEHAVFGSYLDNLERIMGGVVGKGLFWKIGWGC